MSLEKLHPPRSPNAPTSFTQPSGVRSSLGSPRACWTRSPPSEQVNPTSMQRSALSNAGPWVDGRAERYARGNTQNWRSMASDAEATDPPSIVDRTQRMAPTGGLWCREFFRGSRDADYRRPIQHIVSDTEEIAIDVVVVGEGIAHIWGENGL